MARIARHLLPGLCAASLATLMCGGLWAQPAVAPTFEEEAAKLLAGRRFTDALELCKRRIAADAADESARGVLHSVVDACVTHGQAAVAEAFLWNWSQQDADSLLAHVWLGTAIASQPGREQEAVNAYRRAAELDETCADAHHGLASLLQRQGDEEEARSEWERFLELEKDSDRAWLVRHGLAVIQETNVTNTPGGMPERVPAWSPDGKKLAFARGWEGNVWWRDLRTGEETQLTTSNLNDASLDWSPDGKEILFSKRTEDWGKYWLYSIAVHGNGKERLVTERSPASVGRWSPDGRRIVLKLHEPAMDRVCLVNPDGSEFSVLPLESLHGPYSQGQAVFTMPSFGPDGTTLVCQQVGERDGDGTVAVLALDDPPREVLGFFLLGRNQFPRQSPDGQFILFSRESRDKVFDLYVLPGRRSMLPGPGDPTAPAPVFAEKPPPGREEILRRTRPISGWVTPRVLIRCNYEATYGPQPAWSPDGRQIAFSRPVFGDVWIASLGGLDTRAVRLGATRQDGGLLMSVTNTSDAAQTVTVTYDLFDQSSVRVAEGAIAEQGLALKREEVIECPVELDAAKEAAMYVMKLTAVTDSGERVVELVELTRK